MLPQILLEPTFIPLSRGGGNNSLSEAEGGMRSALRFTRFAIALVSMESAIAFVGVWSAIVHKSSLTFLVVWVSLGDVDSLQHLPIWSKTL